MSDFLNFTKRTALKAAFDFFAPVVPAASRAWSRMEAQDIFLYAKNQCTDQERIEAFGSVVSCFKKAGLDSNSDKPYQEVLGLKNGRREFYDMILAK